MSWYFFFIIRRPHPHYTIQQKKIKQNIIVTVTLPSRLIYFAVMSSVRMAFKLFFLRGTTTTKHCNTFIGVHILLLLLSFHFLFLFFFCIVEWILFIYLWFFIAGRIKRVFTWGVLISVRMEYQNHYLCDLMYAKRIFIVI